MDRLRPGSDRSAWLDHGGDLPIIDGTLTRLQVNHLTGDRDPSRSGLWSSATGTGPQEMDRLWQAFCVGPALEHTFCLFKQVPGLDRPKIRDPGRRGPVDLGSSRPSSWEWGTPTPASRIIS